jgi:hypothetical protein
MGLEDGTRRSRLRPYVESMYCIRACGEGLFGLNADQVGA